MNSKAIGKYFIDINIFNIPFSLLIGLTLGFLWSIITFCSLGILIGYLGFDFFKENEYYSYYNLGFTKSNLLKKVWFLNTSISLVIFLIYIIIG
ncbi:hypothetical protein [Tenacibaculum aquimarinum]|uniref:hypothetical protein n=1 Tax=Tenacibaculum aquimarinum TaxID=2910675 RepID=UPI001F0B30F0|nr:hypothetical protein [Tenacibaculum aquimarinum]MCH3884684.1 hypothetical protein [Tenacibaculum aquimarinum]